MIRTSLIYTLGILLFASISANAQKGTVLYSDEGQVRHVDHSDYDNIKGSPYLFEEWYEAKVIGMDGQYTEYLKMNFNGLTHQLELLEDNKTKVLVENSYLKAIINDGTNEFTFMAGIHPELGRNKICILYDGNEIKLIKDFTVRIEESVMQTPGAPTVFEKFSSTVTHYLMKRGNLIRVKLRKKSILGALADNPSIDQYAKKEKIDFGSESDLRKLLEYYESTLDR